MSRETIVYHISQGIGVAGLLLAVLSRGTLPWLGGLITYGSYALLAGGAVIVISCAGRTPTKGEIAPSGDSLLTDGPYQFVRHPYYLGVLMLYVGLMLVLRSLLGLLVALVLVIPLTLYRARLEERELEKKFGFDWQTYAERTPFIIPWPR